MVSVIGLQRGSKRSDFRIPSVDVTVEDMPCEETVKEVQNRNSRIKIIALSPNKVSFDCGDAELVSSQDPAELLKLLETLGGRSEM